MKYIVTTGYMVGPEVVNAIEDYLGFGAQIVDHVPYPGGRPGRVAAVIEVPDE